ncbi:MAG TPA: serine hydrolase domain-containing protein [Acidisarcina sp.]
MRPISIPESAADQRKQFARAYAVLETGITERGFPGASFGVISKGRLLAVDGIGHFTYGSESNCGRAIESVEPLHRPVTPFTVYDVASLTKVLATTAMAMLLHDRGILDLDEPVGDILPGFVAGMDPGSGKNKVTLKMLLAHSSGLPGYARLFEAHPTPQQMLRACLRMPLEALPGARAEYSDIGFILLGAAIEVLSGQKLASLCMREIFEPLGMTQTRFCPPVNLRDAIPPTECDTTFRQRVVQGEVHDENCYALGGSAGHAGLFSSARDVLRYAECILGGGKTALERRSDTGPSDTEQGGLSANIAGTARLQLFGSQIFRPQTVELFATRQITPAGTSRALGWDTPTKPSSSGKFFSPGSVGHLGYTGTSVWIDRDRELAVVLLTNRTWPGRNRPAASWEAIRRIRPQFHDMVCGAL